jgi:rhodanese-related sulfurtransferase
VYNAPLQVVYKAFGRMDPLLTFFLEHWLLSAAFVAIVIALIINEWRHRSFGMASVGNQELVDLLNHSGAALVDIRPSSRFQHGHITGAINIPKEEIETRLNMLNKYKSKPIILVCSAGVDSPKLSKLLKANGFNQLYFLAGGIDMWQSQGLPLVKK